MGQLVPSDFTVNVQIDDADIYKIGGAIYLGIVLWFLLRKGKK